MKETKYVRIIGTTLNPNDVTKAMIGGIFEVKDIEYEDKEFSVYTDKEKSDYWFFNFSDVQEVCLEAVVDGYVLGVGDMIDIYDEPILGFCVADNDTYVRCGTKEKTYQHYLSDIEFRDITTLYNSTAIIKIGEKLYNKSEVDTALANLKEIK